MSYRAITGVMKARTAFHIGSGKGAEVADALIRRDSDGVPVIPGTAIAGALRGLLTRLAPCIEGAGICRTLFPEDDAQIQTPLPCDCAVCRLMGNVMPLDAAGSKARASRLYVYNAKLLDPALPMIRDGVGIDRVTGTAAREAAAKFDLEVLPAGTRFELRIELWEPADDDHLADDEALLAAGICEWAAGRLFLGGNTSRGLGAFDLEDLNYAELDLDDASELMSYLRSDQPWESASGTQPTEAGQPAKLYDALKRIRLIKPDWDKCDALPVTTGWVAWTLMIRAEGPVLVHDPNAAGLNGFDHAPLLSNLGDWQHPVLPGSGVRGVLRSHAERIARTIVTYQAKAKGGQQAVEHFREHCPACNPLASRRSDDVHGVVLESCDSLLRHVRKLDENKEVDPDDLCLACQCFGSTRNGSRFRVEDAPLVGEPIYKMLDFLAVDRFTGGGAEHLKFDALALWQPTFELRIMLESPKDWELGWLALVLRDLAEGWLQVGFGAAKGFGQVKIVSGTMTEATLVPGSPPVDARSLFTTTDWPWDSPELKNRQQAWVKTFNVHLGDNKGFRASEDMALPADSYFDGRLDLLYPIQEVSNA